MDEHQVASFRFLPLQEARLWIPLDVGHHSVSCGPPFHSMWAGIMVMWAVVSAMRDSRAAPQVSASRFCRISFLPLLFHSCHLRSKRLPVAFWNRRFLHFLDDVGEVLQAGDRSSGSGVEHGDVLTGTSQQDCPRDLFHGNASLVHAERQLFIGG